ncbi:MAG: hypothetical protein J5617_04060 [Bacilli bacterium]|nr:hypothetical protein [Bacilli bacterium]
MDYNNPFAYPTFSQQFQKQSPQFTVGWVQGGEIGAKQYYVPPNSTAVLFDAENAEIFYWKSTDSSGMPTIRIADFKFRDNLQAAASPVTKDDIDELRNQIKELREDLDGLSIKRVKKKEDD